MLKQKEYHQLTLVIPKKSHGNICSKNYYNINNKIDIQKFLSDNLKGPINNYDINKISNQVIWIKKMLSTNLNFIKGKSCNNNCNSNYNNDKVGGKEQKLDDLEDLE